MAEPTIQQVFGPNAAQTANSLTISKADLANVGLTASANNTAESLFTALLLLFTQTLTVTNQENNPDQSITVAKDEFNFQELVSRNNTLYRKNNYVVNLQKVDNGGAIDPDDY